MTLRGEWPPSKRSCVRFRGKAGEERLAATFLRNVLARIPKGSAEMVAAAIRTVFAQPDRAAVREQLEVIAERLEPRFPAVATMLREAREELTPSPTSRSRTGRKSGRPTRSSA